MEKPLAAAAGLGWQGKAHQVFWAAIRSATGSFLGGDLPLHGWTPAGPDAPQADHCGSCTRLSLDICPQADAFPVP